MPGNAMMIERCRSDEIGRELLASDLKERQIVWIKPPDAQNRGLMFTFWVTRVAPDNITFFSGVKRMYVVNFRGPNDTVIDDRGRQVRVFEYLGEP
jgi:hypothetical protein